MTKEKDFSADSSGQPDENKKILNSTPEPNAARDMRGEMHLPSCSFMKPGEEPEINRLVRLVFDEFNKPGYSDEGVKGFYSYVDPLALSSRSRQNHFVLTMKIDQKIAGIIEVSDFDHISLFFVDKSYQHQGIGRSLLESALQHCRQQKNDLKFITVNAAPYAVDIYKRLGFMITGIDKTVNGIYFTPMMRNVM